jgi:hypothetical protein
MQNGRISGLKEWGQDPLVLDLGGGGHGRRRCLRWWRSLLHAFPACRGGKEERCGGPATLQGQHRRHLPAWCYVRFVFELNHADGWLASALFCWHGGIKSTSCVEVLPPSSWSSTPGFHQVICPRWFLGVQQRWSFVGFGRSSFCA